MFNSTSLTFVYPSAKEDTCTTVTCMNGGTCSGRGDVFNCMCPFGYSGNLCEISKFYSNSVYLFKYAIPKPLCFSVFK